MGNKKYSVQRKIGTGLISMTLEAENFPAEEIEDFFLKCQSLEIKKSTGDVTPKDDRPGLESIAKFLAWYRESGEVHSIGGLKKRGPRGADTLARRAVKEGLLELHDTHYNHPGGYQSHMQGLYFPGEAPAPMPWAKVRGRIMTYIQEHPGCRSKAIESRCGAPKGQATKTLSRLLATGVLKATDKGVCIVGDLDVDFT